MTVAVAFPGLALTPDQRAAARKMAREQFVWFVAQGYTPQRALEALGAADFWPSWDVVEGQLFEAAAEMVRNSK